MARYIDAEKLKKNIRVNLMPNVDIDGTVTVENAERYFLNLIDKTSTADVDEVTHGEWKKISVASKEYGYGQVYYQHSSCKMSPTELYQSPYERCPRCGAKMNNRKGNK